MLYNCHLTSYDGLQILGSGMSNKMWEALLEHAKTCVMSGKLYVYYPDETRNVGVAFNNIYELTGLITDENFQPIDSLSDSEKVNNDLYTSLENFKFRFC